MADIKKKKRLVQFWKPNRTANMNATESRTYPVIRAIANSFAASLSLCLSRRRTFLQLAWAVQANLITFVFQPRAYILNLLSVVYCEPSELRYARQLFDEIPKADKIVHCLRLLYARRHHPRGGFSRKLQWVSKILYVHNAMIKV